MCWLYQGSSVGHILASPEAKEGSQQPHGWLRGWNRARLCYSSKEEGKAELHTALPFLSLVADGSPWPAAAQMLGDGD